AGRVLHHLVPLDEAVEKIASLAPLLVVDEFAWDLIDPELQAWYETHHRPDSPGPPSLEEWRWRHPGLHPHDVLLPALRARYDERTLEWVPYFHRWLRGPSSEALETSLIAAGAFPAIGWRWVGLRRARR
ncbi:MAG TPA: hypothetical protein VEG24_01645, partial [Gaiellaceae bacterium]|nr:hypothetical protein [Gaiellaceae bacterium]